MFSKRGDATVLFPASQESTVKFLGILIIII